MPMCLNVVSRAGIEIAVCDCITVHEGTILVIVDVSLTGVRYCDIIVQKNVIPSINAH